MTTPMRERAAKVAEEIAACKLAEAKNAKAVCDHGVASAYLAQRDTALAIGREIRTLPDDSNPTRSALEECVRAMEPLAEYIKRVDPTSSFDGSFGEFFDGGLRREIRYSELREIASALATARNTLQETEK